MLSRYRMLSMICATIGLAGCAATDTDAGSAAAEVSAQRVSAAKELGSLLKSQLAHQSQKDFANQLEHAYVKLHLRSRDGKWMLPEAQNIADVLMPASYSLKTANELIDTMSSNVEDNPYLVDFLEAARKEVFPTLAAKFLREGKTVIPETVAVAFAIERITQAELNDPSLIKALSFHWEKERKKAGVGFKQEGIFGVAKLASVEHPIRQIIEFHDGKKLDPDFLRGILPLNIAEAVAADIAKKHFDNAAVGATLARHPPGGAENSALGSGPATFSADRKKILVRYAVAKKWDDLYQVWNMAFCSQINSYPLWISKLFIPQMSDYKNHPDEYIYRRAISLYTALHYMDFSQIEDAKDGIAPIDWSDEGMTKLWGKVNRKSEADYTRHVQEADKATRP